MWNYDNLRVFNMNCTLRVVLSATSKTVNIFCQNELTKGMYCNMGRLLVISSVEVVLLIIRFQCFSGDYTFCVYSGRWISASSSNCLVSLKYLSFDDYFFQFLLQLFGPNYLQVFCGPGLSTRYKNISVLNLKSKLFHKCPFGFMYVAIFWQ